MLAFIVLVYLYVHVLYMYRVCTANYRESTVIVSTDQTDAFATYRNVLDVKVARRQTEQQVLFSPET